MHTAPRLPEYLAERLTELGTASLSHSLNFLAGSLMNCRALNRDEIEELGNLLAVLGDYAQILDVLYE